MLSWVPKQFEATFTEISWVDEHRLYQMLPNVEHIFFWKF